ncbi:MAG: hypothetical protein KF803_02440 [Cyclobacteriaceae bacterium]|nr:hypothetical protein [Cyclobacteriaceae bacterium]
MKAIKRKRIKEVFNTNSDQLQLSATSKAGLYCQWKEWRSKDVNRFDVLVNDLQDDDEAVEVLVQMLISLLDYPDVNPFLKHHFEATDRPNTVAYRNKIIDQLIYKESELNSPFLIEEGYVVENWSYPYIVTKIRLVKQMVEEFNYDYNIREIRKTDSIYIPTEKRNDTFLVLTLFTPKNMHKMLQSLVDNKFDKSVTINFSGKANLICSLFYHLTTFRAISSLHETTKNYLTSNCTIDGVKRSGTIKQVFKEGNEIKLGAVTKTGKPKNAKRLSLDGVREKIISMALDNEAIASALTNLFGTPEAS